MLTERARQLLRTVQRWQPTRQIVVVADSGFAALALLAAVTNHTLSVVTRLRLDAALYEPAPPRRTSDRGRPRKKGQRVPTLEQVLADPNTHWHSLTVSRWYGEVNRTVEIASATAVWFHNGMPPVALRWVLIRDPTTRFKTQALLCTHPQATPTDIVQWFVQRGQVEVTFEEARVHLGVETQRQWSPSAIARTTPVLLALFSLVTLIAQQRLTAQALPIRCSAWYRKTHPTFSDALALVRRQIWATELFSMSRSEPYVWKIPYPVLQRLTELLCFAA